MALNPREIYYGIDGERHGPVTLEELRELVGSGQLRAEDYLWDEDETDWVSVKRYPFLFGAIPPPPLRGPDDEDADFAPVDEDHPAVVAQTPAFRTADPVTRAVAWVLDFLVMALPNTLWQYAVQSRMGPAVERLLQLETEPTAADVALAWKFLAVVGTGSFVLGLAYYAVSESSRWQGTLGKRIMGLVVTDERGRRIGMGHAALRYFGRIPCRLTLGFGYLMILLTERRQGMHDKLAGTLVLRR